MTPDQSPTGAVERLEALAVLSFPDEAFLVHTGGLSRDESPTFGDLRTVLSTLRQPTAAPEGWREALEKIIGLCSYKDNLSDARGIAEQALSSAPPAPVQQGEGWRHATERLLTDALRLQVDALIGEVCTLQPQGFRDWEYEGKHWTDRIAKRAVDALSTSRLSTPEEPAKESPASYADREGVKQPFEAYPKLAAWIEKLATRKIEGFSLGSWCAFLGELNAALTAAAGGRPTREEVEAVFAELSGRVGAPSWGYAIDKARDAILALFPTSEGAGQ